MSRFHSPLWPGLILAALFLTGCEAIPVSQHPLSDETNSEVDPALLGMWDIIDLSQEEQKEPAAPDATPAAEDAKKTEPTPDEERPPRFGIGRLGGKERSMELVSMHLTDEHVEIKRMPFHTTKVGKQPILSIRANPEEMASDFILLRYEIVNENRILVYFLNRDVVVKAIQRGELKGVVRKAATKDPNDPNAEQRKEQIRMTASPEELRDFLTKNEKTVFDPKAMWRLQRAAAN